MLGKKQSLEHADFVAAIGRIEELVPRATFDRACEKAIREIRYQADACGGRIAYAWSGGKDSIALGGLCEAAGISRCCFGMTTGLEYPTFLAWVTDNMPPGLEVLHNGWDLAWLVKHPDMLFPPNASVAAKWFKGVQHNAQAKYYRKHKLGTIVLGRRWIDGNYTGRGNGEILYEADGIVRFSPIASWSHELVLAYLHYHGWTEATLPPFYRWPRGYRCGTHAWPARQWTQGEMHGWTEVASIDRSIVELAAEYFPLAREALRS